MKGWFNIAAVLLLLAPAAAIAQQKGAIELKTVAEVEVVEVNAKGEKVAVRKEASQTKVVPGDTVIFTTTYKNKGKQAATGVVITNPVPEHMTYTDKSAAGADTRIDFSVDGGKTYASPDKLTVKDAAGKARKAVPADYTHIRWIVTKPVAGGASGSVTFRAKVK